MNGFGGVIGATFGAGWRVRVGLDQELLLRQVHHQHVVGVQDARDVTDLDGPRPVGQHAPVADALHRRLPPDFARWSGLTVAGSVIDALEERPARLAG